MIITNLKTLRNKSAIFVIPESIDTFISELETELKNSPIPGVGLSAIQLGYPLRIAIIRTDKISLDLYNTKIITCSEPTNFKGEGCLSLPLKYVTTKRMNKIIIKNGDGKIYELEGFEAIAVQHELDHWDGILMIDRSI